MDDIREREKVAREIERTIESIRKKHRALKSGRIEEDIKLEKRFKPIIEPLQKIVDSTSVREIKEEPGDVVRKREKAATKRTRKSDVTYDLPSMTSTPRTRVSDVTYPVPSMASTPRDVSATRKREREEEEEDEEEDDATPRKSVPRSEVFETTGDSFATAVQHEMQTSEGREALSRHLGPLGREYIGDFLRRGEKDKIIDTVYGVYLDKDGTMMLGSKKFDVDSTDHIIIDGVRYAGTPGLYELIFKKIPDDEVYTEDDKRKYKSIMQATNAHRRDYTERGQIRANRGHKYRFVIMPLLKDESKIGKGIPRAMTLNDNAIDYEYWDDPNELVDRLRLLDASRRAGNNMHDNEMLSIIEELREAGLIIN